MRRFPPAAPPVGMASSQFFTYVPSLFADATLLALRAIEFAPISAADQVNMSDRFTGKRPGHIRDYVTAKAKYARARAYTFEIYLLTPRTLSHTDDYTNAITRFAVNLYRNRKIHSSLKNCKGNIT